jgi:hypothetical protein
MYGAFSNITTIMKKAKPAVENLGISSFESRWKRRSPDYASVEVLEINQEPTVATPPIEKSFTVIRPKRIATGKRAPVYKVLTFQDLAILHLALTRQYQNTVVDSVANQYDNLLAQLEDILQSRPDTIRFR